MHSTDAKSAALFFSSASSEPDFISPSNAFLFTILRSIFVTKSSIDSNLSASSINFAGVSPTFFKAESAYLIFSPPILKSKNDLLTSGGNIWISLFFASCTKDAILSVLFISKLNKAVKNSSGKFAF